MKLRKTMNPQKCKVCGKKRRCCHSQQNSKQGFFSPIIACIILGQYQYRDTKNLICTFFLAIFSESSMKLGSYLLLSRKVSIRYHIFFNIIMFCNSVQIENLLGVRALCNHPVDCIRKTLPFFFCRFQFIIYILSN